MKHTVMTFERALAVANKLLANHPDTATLYTQIRFLDGENFYYLKPDTAEKVRPKKEEKDV